MGVATSSMGQKKESRRSSHKSEHLRDHRSRAVALDYARGVAATLVMRPPLTASGRLNDAWLVRVSSWPTDILSYVCSLSAHNAIGSPHHGPPSTASEVSFRSSQRGNQASAGAGP